MTANVISGLGSITKSIFAGTSAITETVGAVGKGLRVARIGVWYGFGVAGQGLGAFAAIFAVLIAVPVVHVLQRFVAMFAKMFASWKDNRNAAVSTASVVKVRIVRVFVVTPLLVFVFGVFYLFIALFHAIWKRIFLITIVFFLCIVFLSIQVYSGYIIDFTQRHLNLASTTINTVGAYSGTAGEAFNIALPSFNAVWQNQLTTGRTFVNFVQGQDILGRRNLGAPSLQALAKAVGPAIKLSATTTVAIHRIELVILAFGLEIILPILPFILPGLDFVVQRIGCFLIGFDGLCNLKEAGQAVFITAINDLIIGPINDLGGHVDPLDIACQATELSGGPECNEPGGFPAYCTGSLLSLTTGPGIYTHGCGASRRVLCQQEGNVTCERVNGDLVHCHVDPAQGCPHTHRALSTAGHILNTEDLETPCYEVCANRTLSMRCNDGWKEIGTCSSNGTAALKRKPKKHAPTMFGKPVTQPGGKKSPDFKPIMNAVQMFMQASALFRTRRDLYEETGDWEAAWAHSKATDKVPLFREVDWAVHALVAASRIPDELPKPPPRRVLKTAVSACADPTQTLCCDQTTCVPAGGTCPPINPNSWSEQWCQAVEGATNAVENFDISTYIASVIQCVDSWDSDPDTNPFGPDADTSQRINYCFPMSGPVDWGFGGVSMNLKSVLNSACGNLPGLTTANCECPMYSGNALDFTHEWFAYVGVGYEGMLYDFFIVLQLMISALTGQDGPFWFIGVSWYSVWIPFPWLNNTWWPYLFLLRQSFTSWPQEEFCATIHFGSFWTVVWLLIWASIIIEVFWPLMEDIVEVGPWPSHFKRIKNTDETVERGRAIEDVKSA